jgi:hypothetical protein
MAALAPLVFLSAAWALDEPTDKSEPPAKPATLTEKVKDLQKEMLKTRSDLQAKLRDAEKDEDKAEIRKEIGDLNRKFADRYLELAEQNVKDPAAADALLMVFRTAGPTSPEAGKAADLIVKERLYGPPVVAILPALARMNAPYTERLLRGAAQDAKGNDDRGRATLALADFLRSKAERGNGNAKLEAEAEQLYRTVMEKYADVKVNGRQKLGGLAKGAVNEWRHLKVGKPAPEIEGEDVDGAKFKLSDYRGKVVMLDFWGNW